MSVTNPSARLKSYAHPSEFMTDCGPLLCAREAENNLFLGVVGVLGTPSSPYQEFYLASVAGETIEGAFLMTPPRGLILSSPASDTAMALVVENLLAMERNLPDVIGRSDLADKFADMWIARTGDKASISLHLYCYQISRVADIPLSSGRWRRATLDDIDFMVSWIRGFNHDIGEEHDDDRVRKGMINGIPEGRYHLWEDGGPVSMLRSAPTTPTGERINAVYTPPEFRGCGYASSLTWAVSRLLLQSGKKFCFLFTDARNPTSNKIYQRIGYEKVCDFHSYAFSEK
jgi:hypothetical protein